MIFVWLARLNALFLFPADKSKPPQGGFDLVVVGMGRERRPPFIRQAKGPRPLSLRLLERLLVLGVLAAMRGLFAFAVAAA